ncbi:hypothetical protein F4802DRAFT_542795 [Xylaria palmicola]|nr:hypothetical protein F4802DRAFT_542795 [Xylaria palmicola]
MNNTIAGHFTSETLDSLCGCDVHVGGSIEFLNMFVLGLFVLMFVLNNTSARISISPSLVTSLIICALLLLLDRRRHDNRLSLCSFPHTTLDRNYEEPPAYSLARYVGQE